MEGGAPRKRKPSETRFLVKSMLDRGLSQAEVARKLDLRKSTVSYHARRLGRPVDDRAARRYDWDKVQQAYDQGSSVRGCMATFGFSANSWHQAVRRGAISPRAPSMPLEDLLVEGRRTSRKHLKLRLINAELKANKCELCGITDWCEKPLSMALHHINGRGLDNRLENLQFLCPNCHAQTNNYSGRGVKRRTKDR